MADAYDSFYQKWLNLLGKMMSGTPTEEIEARARELAAREESHRVTSAWQTRLYQPTPSPQTPLAGPRGIPTTLATSPTAPPAPRLGSAAAQYQRWGWVAPRPAKQARTAPAALLTSPTPTLSAQGATRQQLLAEPWRHWKMIGEFPEKWGYKLSPVGREVAARSPVIAELTARGEKPKGPYSLGGVTVPGVSGGVAWPDRPTLYGWPSRSTAMHEMAHEMDLQLNVIRFGGRWNPINWYRFQRAANAEKAAILKFFPEWGKASLWAKYGMEDRMNDPVELYAEIPSRAVMYGVLIPASLRPWYPWLDDSMFEKK